ncbi:MAG: 4-deoxy-4-formamido-L-arabinose-phosphoundecaprenol deformylase [Holophagales bacterium]|jgi:peptidoglycan/xylan/chitin deacetylase (PgdA/CDA1 family)|nr:4-deoxy-4-formamido-L-arabinose-phosphoundecaprenol deformylase [Holophagales bacterium]
MKTLALRVDVDTLEGSLNGIPRLLKLFDRHQVRASFYFSFGPDNSGKALRRIFRPGFLSKMRRTGAGRLYGIKTMLYGTLLPAPIIHSRAKAEMRAVQSDGHEVGIHAWDHVQYHDLLDKKPRQWLQEWHQRAHGAFEDVFGFPARASASPAWRSNDNTLEIQEQFNLDYAGDCRGLEAFYPIVGGKALSTLQVPTTLPTLDEMLGLNGWGAKEALSFILGQIRDGALNIYTLHTEVEGGAHLETFSSFIDSIKDAQIQTKTNAELVPGLKAAGPPTRTMTRRELDGRAGWVSWG